MKKGFTLVELPAVSKRGFTLVELPAVSKRGFTLVELPAVSKRGFTLVELPAVSKRGFTLVELPAVSKRGFTLVELLVTIAIVGALIALLLPAVTKMMGKADIATAKTDAARVVSAWGQYYAEYGRWPVGGPTERLFFPCDYQQAAAENGQGMEMTMAVMTNIMQPNMSMVGSRFNAHPVRTNFNPRGIVFMRYDTESLSTNGLVDPWGNTYRFLFDLNKDGRVERSGGTNSVYANVIAWSLGPDGALSGDDVRSWE